MGNEEPKEDQMKSRRIIIVAWCFLFLLLIQAGFGRAFLAQPDPARVDGAQKPSERIFMFEGCKISVLSTYFWRDWMPIVEHPGPDHGSPLYSKIKLRIENTSSGPAILFFKAAIIDEQGRSYPASFSVQPDYKLLPKSAYDSYSNLDEQGKKDVIAKYGLVWDGSLKQSEVREVELLSHDGPYLRAGSRVHLELAFSNPRGNTIIIHAPSDIINRTD